MVRPAHQLSSIFSIVDPQISIDQYKVKLTVFYSRLLLMIRRFSMVACILSARVLVSFSYHYPMRVTRSI